MNKKEAAAMLGISTRALENRAGKGQLTVTYQKGATGDEAVFDEKEIKRLRDELDRKRGIVRPAVAPDEPESRELMRGYGSGLSGDAAAVALLGRLVESLAVSGSGKARPSVAVESKLTLKLDEAAAVSGLSRMMLREAVAAGKLKAKIIGRAWRVKRADLEAFIKKL